LRDVGYDRADKAVFRIKRYPKPALAPKQKFKDIDWQVSPARIGGERFG
jgi:hypothetical protein